MAAEVVVTANGTTVMVDGTDVKVTTPDGTIVTVTPVVPVHLETVSTETVQGGSEGGLV